MSERLARARRRWCLARLARRDRAAAGRGDRTRFRTILLGGAAPPLDRPGNVVATWGMTETGSGIVYDGRSRSTGSTVAERDGKLYVKGPMLARALPRRHRDLPRSGPDGTMRLARDERRGARPRRHRRGARPHRPTSSTTGGREGLARRRRARARAASRVREVAVWRRDDDEWGERVVAWIVPAGDPPALGELAALRRRCCSRRGPRRRSSSLRDLLPQRGVRQGREAPARRVETTPPEDRVVVPPSTTTTCAGDPRRGHETRNSAIAATSSTSPMRPRGMWRADPLLVALPQRPASSVRTRPGARPFTRTLGRELEGELSVRWMTAAFVALYQPMPGSAPQPADRGDVEDRARRATPSTASTPRATTSRCSPG